jgi:dTDP-glucose 4,6-dehydratase
MLIFLHQTGLGWSPRVNFADGMKQTIEWSLDYKAWIASVTDGSYREYYEKMNEKR